jgi:hypothetical protein
LNSHYGIEMAAKLVNAGYRPGPLASPADLRRKLARLYRDGCQGLVSTADASRLAGILNILARLLETTEIEERIERLEETARETRSDAFSAH